METRLQNQPGGQSAGMSDPHQPGTPPGMSAHDVSARADLARFLGKECWPASRSELEDIAGANHAPAEILHLLARLPENRRFSTLAEVWEELGGHNESRRP